MAENQSKHKTAIYPGSFDPVTNGHLDILKRAAKLFDKVIVAVGDNRGKKPLFTASERMSMLKSVCKSMKNVEIDSFTGLMIEYAKKKNADAIIRGLRAVSDFDYEFQMALINRKLEGEIETVFIMTAENYVYLNSGIVKEIVGFGGSAKDLVPKEVEDALRRKLR